MLIVAATVSASCSSGDDLQSAPRGGVGTSESLVGGPWVSPEMPTATAPLGAVEVVFTNRSTDSVPLTYFTHNNPTCETNSWLLGSQSSYSGTFPDLDPGDTGVTAFTSTMCTWRGNRPPHTGESAHRVGVDGAAQFEFGSDFDAVSGNFNHFTWRGDYTDGDSTEGLVMVECDVAGSDGSYVGTGPGGTNSNLDFKDRERICFDYFGPPRDIAQDDTCEAQNGLAVNCQATNQIGKIATNVNVDFKNCGDAPLTVHYVGLHGDSDSVNVGMQESTTVGLGAGHFGTLTLENDSDDAGAELCISSITSA